MAQVPESVADFLSQERIAVVGVSRHPMQAANMIYRKLRSTGYDVVAVNPSTDRIEGDVCYPSVAAIPKSVDAAVVVTAPEVSDRVIQECAACGIPRAWLHRSVGRGSMSESAVEYGREQGMQVIAGGCPMMYCKPVDIAHTCVRWLLGATGRLPS
jgi:hypothetical protein